MEHGAGIVVIRFFGAEPRLLGLRAYGRFDVPKGRIEGEESPLTAALRETEEEAGPMDLGFRWGDASMTLQNLNRARPKRVQLFIAETGDDPQIRANPVTGEFEHHGYAWLALEDAGTMLYTYLRPIVPWVRSILDAEGRT